MYQRVTDESFDDNAPYIGEIQIFAGDFAPTGWVFCNGAMLSATTYWELYSVIGNAYGDDPAAGTFALPNLQDQVLVSVGNNGSFNYSNVGAFAGSANTALLINNLPNHTHIISGSAALPAIGDNPGTSNTLNSITPSFAIGGGTDTYYSTIASGGKMQAVQGAVSLGTTGSSVPVNNMMPYLALNYIICLSGIYPSPGA